MPRLVILAANGRSILHLDRRERKLARAGLVLAFTHDDRYKPLPGYKTMLSHFHTGTVADPRESGGLDMELSWLAPVRALGVNIFNTYDTFSRQAPQPVRLKDLADYYEIARF